MRDKRCYVEFIGDISKFIPSERIYTDELRRLAWGTDAGFYRLIPQIIIRSDGEDQVARILALATSHRLPVTFRAAGTSLSGQAISDSILIVAGKHWQRCNVSSDGGKITLQPGVVGQQVNEILRPFGRKFAPDPASIKSAMVGGIVMNNASGMNCGTHANSDRVLLSARIVFVDGVVLDTGSEESCSHFQQLKPEFIERICQIRDELRANEELRDRILYKYSIKNVTGLNILPLVTFDNPFDIIAHLMVGSEGTLAFLSEVTMKTEYDYPHKASAMLYFSSIEQACAAVVAMKKMVDSGGESIVKGVELLDSKSLKSVNDTTGEGLTALLTETKGRTKRELSENIAAIESVLAQFDTFAPVYFTDKPEEYSKYWSIRSGIFPSVGGMRRLGTTSLIEDIAFHIENLPAATVELQQLISNHGYDDGCIYGHALEGNYHIIINQSFDSEVEVERYEMLMEDIKKLVVDKYDGSLKAEHGTGRNMAPYVEYEWGKDAFEIMKRVKDIFDPHRLLNPGVIFNDDLKCHIKNLKPLPLSNKYIDKCIECGFCEVNCLSCGLTLSSRQRIVVQREISHLKRRGGDEKRVKELQRSYRYYGEESCAGDGLCSMSCPMGINVGDMTHAIREHKALKGSLVFGIGDFAANHFAGVKNCLRPMLTAANGAHALLGGAVMGAIAQSMHRFVGAPLWVSAMPKAYRLDREMLASRVNVKSDVGVVENLKVVYFPSCINQTMGLPKESPVDNPLVKQMVMLLQKAGYETVFPANMDKLCCGTIWESKGMGAIADKKSAELETALWEASDGGKYPVLCDQSPCLKRMRESIKKMKIYEPVEFIYLFLRDRLEFTPTNNHVALHITCSMRKMGLAESMVSLAKLCSTQVFIPDQVGCCGFAGDKGFTMPEINRYALRKLAPQLKYNNIGIGYSNSRTCEIGLTTNGKIPYISIVYLVDECTKAKNR